MTADDFLNALARAPEGAAILCLKSLPYGLGNEAFKENKLFVNKYGYAFLIKEKASVVDLNTHIELPPGAERYVRRNPEDAATD